jgi:radical SAM protein with 4Fe4S-binding SPASM domain
VAILVDGTVAPCCLDADAQLMLGNIFEDDFENIINGERAQRMISGFQKRMVSEKICMDCGFVLL